jgi:hypothetical protein
MSNVLLHRDICEELIKIYVSKNQDYGNSFSKQFEEYGLISSAIRLEDKFQRFKNLIKNKAQVKNETIEDTLLDLANYAIMTVMELRGQRESDR